MDESVDLEPYVQDANHRVMRRFWKWVDREDVAQELRLWLYAHPKKVEEYLTEDRTHSLVKALENAGIRYAQREKAVISGYHPDDNYYWSKGDIESHLIDMFNDDAWLNAPALDGDQTGRSSKPSSEGGNWIATLADLSRVYGELDDRTKWTLLLVYGEDRTRVYVAKALGVSDTTVGNIIDRAIKKMHRSLGGDKPASHQNCDECTGTRRVISNATAAAITTNQYEE